MYRLTIDQAAHRPAVVSIHSDRTTAAAALADYLTAHDCDPVPNQLTDAHQSYDLVSLAEQRVIATATIEFHQPDARAA
ncbi:MULTISPECIES: hypothetical protein [Mycolicibacterium]|uniref:Uncharacterized protein n=1 Tax=Mycolicibacterium llatzerense TaxID=280871 RepID=A0A0D1JPW6_9MYCO|nr:MULTISPECIES: hypothetical protein [Mycolicibacterium]KIU14599.1 hypothetical protein TL10_23290 [Mycolicibacterium llatzerense]MCT7372090.1 hypothetical protein [Mycolicibacterium llatzerense]WGI35884.1 hypothetical protein QDT91_27725 [Mycolicibacterium aubagnense]